MFIVGVWHDQTALIPAPFFGHGLTLMLLLKIWSLAKHGKILALWPTSWYVSVNHRNKFELFRTENGKPIYHVIILLAYNNVSFCLFSSFYLFFFCFVLNSDGEYTYIMYFSHLQMTSREQTFTSSSHPTFSTRSLRVHSRITSLHGWKST